MLIKVSTLESFILKGGRVGEKDVVNVVKLLMNELIKFDGIIIDGDVNLQRKMQENSYDTKKVCSDFGCAKGKKTRHRQQMELIGCVWICFFYFLFFIFI